MFFMFACTQEEDNLLSENEKATAQIPELTTAEAQMNLPSYCLKQLPTVLKCANS